MNICNTDVSRELDKRFKLVREGLPRKEKLKFEGWMLGGLPIVFILLIILL